MVKNKTSFQISYKTLEFALCLISMNEEVSTVREKGKLYTLKIHIIMLSYSLWVEDGAYLPL